MYFSIFFGILSNAFMHMSSIFVFLFLYVILFILNIIFSYQSKKGKNKIVIWQLSSKHAQAALNSVMRTTDLRY